MKTMCGKQVITRGKEGGGGGGLGVVRAKNARVGGSKNLQSIKFPSGVRGLHPVAGRGGGQRSASSRPQATSEVGKGGGPSL